RRPWLVALGYALPFVAFGAHVAIQLSDVDGLGRLWLWVSVPWLAAMIFPWLIAAASVTSYVLTRDPFARRRMRTASYGLGAMAACYLLLGLLPEQLSGQPLIDWQYMSLLFIPVQLMFGAAVLRYRLWDVQLILRRWLVHGLVTAAVLGLSLPLAAAVGA